MTEDEKKSRTVQAEIQGRSVEIEQHGMQPGRRPTCGIFCLPYGAEEDGRSLVVLAGQLENVLAFVHALYRVSRGTCTVLAGMLSRREGDVSAFGITCLGSWPAAAQAEISAGFAELGNSGATTWATHYFIKLEGDPRREPGPAFIGKKTAQLVRELFDHQCASSLN